MAVWNVINRSSLRESLRIDAEYQKPADVALERSLLNHGATFLKVYIQGFSSGKNLPQVEISVPNAVGFIRTQNIRPFLINDDGLSYSRPCQQATIEKGDLLAVRVGAGVGDISVTGVHHQGHCISDNVLRIKVTRINSFFLGCYLLSKYGQQFLQKIQKGTARGLISRENFNYIPVMLIPYPQQQWFEDALLSAEAALFQSGAFYTQAQHLLESELGLDKLSFQKPVGYTARFSELEQSRRLDPEHFYPAFYNLVAHLPDHINLVPLGTQLNFCQRGKQPVYSKHGLPVVNSKHVQSNKVVLEGNRTAISNPNAELQIRHGDILMNGTGRGTLGRVAPYLSDGQAMPDNHVTILRSPTLDPAYLSFYLNSQAGQLQVDMHQRGTSGQLELYPFDIRKFLVWVAPEPIQKEIRNLYDQAAASEQRSKELLNQAKTRVEQLIEEVVRS